jgi:hypothetical protein
VEAGIFTEKKLDEYLRELQIHNLREIRIRLKKSHPGKMRAAFSINIKSIRANGF